MHSNHLYARPKETKWPRMISITPLLSESSVSSGDGGHISGGSRDTAFERLSRLSDGYNKWTKNLVREKP